MGLSQKHKKRGITGVGDLDLSSTLQNALFANISEHVDISVDSENARVRLSS